MEEQQVEQMRQMQEVSSGMGAGMAVVWLLFLAFLIACGWRVFTKAGQPGWAILVPIYNAVVMLKIVGRPVWWLLLLLIPFINLIIGIVLYIDLAKSFGKGTGFGIGLLLLGIVFMPILAFGDAKYVGPAHSAGGAPATATV